MGESSEIEFNDSDNPEKKKETESNQTLDSFLKELQKNNINTLSPEQIKDQLKETGVAIATRDFDCGIRISKTLAKGDTGRFDKQVYKTWTTNLTKSDKWVEKFGLKIIEIE